MIIITGASKGVGRYLFSRFKEDGLDVIGTYNSTIDVLDTDSDSYYKVDVSKYDDVKKWIYTIKDSLTEIVLINCAGVSYNSFAHKSDVSKWNRVIEINLMGSFNVIHELLPIMRDQNFGRIINFSSVLVKLPTLGVSAYSASKSGLVGLTKVLALENGSKGVTVNAINLGYVNMGMGVNDVPDSHQEKLKKNIPSGRFCEPKEIYNTVKFLINTEYVNGADIDINGGII